MKQSLAHVRHACTLFGETYFDVLQEFVVKGFIMTLVSRLEQSGGQWKLTVLINDGTASREVDIDDLVCAKFLVEFLYHRHNNIFTLPILSCRNSLSLLLSLLPFALTLALAFSASLTLFLATLL